MDFYDMPVGTGVVPLLIEQNFREWRPEGGEDRVEPCQTCSQPSYCKCGLYT